MALVPGTYRIEPGQGRLLLRTYRDGVAARVGHDLVIEATRWEGTVAIPPEGAHEATLAVSVDLDGLQVREAAGGAKPLTDRDRAEILRNLRRTLRVDEHPVARYTATGVDVALSGTEGTVHGELTIAGARAPLLLAVHLDEARAKAAATVTQTGWGITPYSALFGTLRVRDGVDVEAEVVLTLE